MASLTVESPLPRGEIPRKAEFIFPPKRGEWPILSSLTIHEAFFEVPYKLAQAGDYQAVRRLMTGFLHESH